MYPYYTTYFLFLPVKSAAVEDRRTLVYHTLRLLYIEITSSPSHHTPSLELIR